MSDDNVKTPTSALQNNLFNLKATLPKDIMTLNALCKRYGQSYNTLWKKLKGNTNKGLPPIFSYYDTCPLMVSESEFIRYMNSKLICVQEVA